jgi:hypothetical protein
VSAASAADRTREVRSAPEADLADLSGNSPRGGGPGIVVPNTHLQTTAVRAG